MPDPWTDLLGCLRLRTRDGERHDAPDVLVFEGVNQQLNYHRLFGGQLLGQFIRAACLTCPDKTVKSLHAVFAREGRADDPVHYQATRHHQGRSFAALTITAHQPRGVLATGSVCMHTAEDGPERQSLEPVPGLLDEKHRVELHLSTIRNVDANTSRRRRSRARADRLRHRPHTHRNGATSPRRFQPSR